MELKIILKTTPILSMVPSDVAAPAGQQGARHGPLPRVPARAFRGGGDVRSAERRPPAEGARLVPPDVSPSAEWARRVLLISKHRWRGRLCRPVGGDRLGFPLPRQKHGISLKELSSKVVALSNECRRHQASSFLSRQSPKCHV